MTANRTANCAHRVARRFGRVTTGLALLAVVSAAWSASNNTLKLLREPTISAQSIVFEYGGELWSVPRSGGNAHVLARGMGRMRAPLFSPDGSKIAFTGTYDGNTDVYVVPAGGGQPQRLTWHPGGDVAVGWSRDGKRVLFRSHRNSATDPAQLYTVRLQSRGLPHALPLSKAETGSYSPNGKRLAYVPGFQWEPFWHDYKGGQYTNIWLAKLSDSSVKRLPNPKSASDNSPMWIGETVYFLSDRSDSITLYAYHTGSGKTDKALDNNGFDITSASAGDGVIVYSQFGTLHVFNPKTHDTRAVQVNVAGDMSQRRVHYQKVGDEIRNAAISPNGVRAVFQTHGEMLTVPAEHGDAANVTHSPGAMDRQPSWSPDGQHIAYFSDADGEYDLYIAAQDGVGKSRKIKLGQGNAYYYDPTWSPDSQKIVFSDQKLNLWMVDLAADKPKPVKIATDNYAQLHAFDARWSPDSRRVVFTKVLDNYLHAAFIYSLANGSRHQITDGMSDVRYPVFDANGKTLYFTSSTDTGLSHGWLDMSRMQRPVTRHVYAATLSADSPSPIAPKTGYENAGDDANKDKNADKDKPKSGEKSASRDKSRAGSGAKNDKKSQKSQKDKTPTVHIDFKGLAKRAAALPIDAENYVGLNAGKSGVLYLQKAPLVATQAREAPSVTVKRFKLDEKKTKELVSGVSHVSFTPNGKKLLYRQHHKQWFIANAKPGKAAQPQHLKTSDLRVQVKPQAEWAQMYHDAWRFQRAFFYDGHYHGLNVKAAEKHFEPYLPGVASRDGLSFLFKEMLSYLSVGHMFIRGGNEPPMEHVGVGLLGADFKVDHGYYRIQRIYDGGLWNPDLKAPLAAPGLKVHTGDYLLAVNGQKLTAKSNLYSAFENLADTQVTLTVGAKPNGEDSHQITVKTIGSDNRLRHAAWIEHNRKRVDKMSHGKLGYVYLPDTYWGGYTNFNRYFFAQVDKKGVIIDERFNHGGLLSDYIINILQRQPMTLNLTRWGKQAVTPPEAIFGPKVMLINQFSGSGGDALPWYFKRDKIGPLVGKRTWGGLVGIGGFPRLMDGGTVTAPNTAVEGVNGNFPVENHGVAPDVEVWQNPAKMRNGHDPQLEKAVSIAMHKLSANPPKQYKPAPPINYHPKLPPLPPHGGQKP